jgi:2-oxoglutarate dehydrogenase E1 component
MYKQIAKQETARSKYTKQLIAEKVITEDEGKAIVDEFEAYLEEAFRGDQSLQTQQCRFPRRCVGRNEGCVW